MNERIGYKESRTEKIRATTDHRRTQISGGGGGHFVSREKHPPRDSVKGWKGMVKCRQEQPSTEIPLSKHRLFLSSSPPVSASTRTPAPQNHPRREALPPFSRVLSAKCRWTLGYSPFARTDFYAQYSLMPYLTNNQVRGKLTILWRPTKQLFWIGKEL